MGECMQPGAVVDMLYIAGFTETGACWCPLSHTLRHQVLGNILHMLHVSHYHIFVHRCCVFGARCMRRCCRRLLPRVLWLLFRMCDCYGASLLYMIRLNCEGGADVCNDVTVRCFCVNLHA